MNVLVIPENSRNDQHILKPLFERLFRSIGRKRAHVEVCQNPVLGGIAEAMKIDSLSTIVESYRSMVQVFILCVDRDGQEGRRRQLDRIEEQFRNDRTFLAANAWEEIETWALAGLKLLPDWSWADVRAEINVKEHYFEPLAKQRCVAEGPGGGRKALGREAARNISVIRRKCAEDFGVLAQRLEDAFRVL